jgi:hypothetical protein
MPSITLWSSSQERHARLIRLLLVAAVAFWAGVTVTAWLLVLILR